MGTQTTPDRQAQPAMRKPKSRFIFMLMLIPSFDDKSLLNQQALLAVCSLRIVIVMFLHA
jgi:hypothetical protein